MAFDEEGQVTLITNYFKHLKLLMNCAFLHTADAQCCSSIAALQLILTVAICSTVHATETVANSLRKLNHMSICLACSETQCSSETQCALQFPQRLIV
jgi:hypothetical protein